MCGPGQGLFLGFFRDSSEFVKGLLRGFFKCSLSVPGKLGFLSFRWDFGVRAFMVSEAGIFCVGGPGREQVEISLKKQILSP